MFEESNNNGFTEHMSSLGYCEWKRTWQMIHRFLLTLVIDSTITDPKKFHQLLIGDHAY